MIHGLKLKIKSLREDIEEVNKGIFYINGEIEKGRARLGKEEWIRLNRLSGQLQSIKKKHQKKKEAYKKQIKSIKKKNG